MFAATCRVWRDLARDMLYVVMHAAREKRGG